MGMTHSYPTSKVQQIVLAGLGKTAENHTEAEKIFAEIGIVVVAVRAGRTSVPSINALRWQGYSEDERFNTDYADIIRENLAQYCNPDFLARLTPVAQPVVVAEQKAEETRMTNLEQALQERGMAEAICGDMDVIVAFDDDSNAFVAKYVYGQLPPHTSVSASTIDALIAKNPELQTLTWSTVSNEE